jgi:hypothetical protein
MALVLHRGRYAWLVFGGSKNVSRPFGRLETANSVQYYRPRQYYMTFQTSEKNVSGHTCVYDLTSGGLLHTGNVSKENLQRIFCKENI